MIGRTRFAALVAAVVIGASGCAANTASSFGAGGVSPIATPPVEGVRVIADGGLFVSATIGLSAAAANVLSAIAVVGFLAVGNNISPRLPAKMREDRAINLQDCSKPIANASANLKCATPEELRELESARSD